MELVISQTNVIKSVSNIGDVEKTDVASVCLSPKKTYVGTYANSNYDYFRNIQIDIGK